MTILAKTYFCTHYSIFEVFLLFYHGKTRFFSTAWQKPANPERDREQQCNPDALR